MGRAATFTIIAFLISLLAGCHKASTASPQAQSTTAAAGVMALGTITPGEAVMQITAPAGSGESRLSRLLVHENDFVEEGTILACLDSEARLRVALASARADLRAREADLRRTLAGRSAFEIGAQSAAVQQVDADLQQKKRDFDRFDELYRTGVVSRQEYEARKASFTVASMQLSNAQQLLKQSAEVRTVDVDVSRAAVNTATVAVQQAQVNLDQACVRAPEAGQILKVNVFPGERIGDAGLMSFAPSNTTYVVAEVYETDVARLHVGQQAIVHSAAIPRDMTGTVTRIGNLVQRQQTVNTDTAANTDARVVRVYVALAAADAKIARTLINLQVTARFQ